uniref:Major facilitator superfamily (MFS) profile domain-containing protein n=1 Tax=Callorhinchus milii TaxID=7868 RepID=A0A4W3HL13_CALMI
LFFLLCPLSVLFSYVYVGFVFLIVRSDHWWLSPGVTELSNKCNWSPEVEKNYTIPLSRNDRSSYSQCERYDIDWNASSVSCDNPLPFVQNSSRALPLTGCQDGWVLARSSFELVCADSRKVDLSQACQYGGFFEDLIIRMHCLSNILVLICRFGRKQGCLIATFVTTVLCVLLAFSPNYVCLSIFRAFQGFFSKGSWLCAYVLVTEIVGPEYRRTTGILFQLSCSVGMMILPAVAYFIQDWRNLQLAATIPNFLFLSYFWLIPESPRWMLSLRKNAEAMKVLQKMTKRNGKTLSRNSEIRRSAMILLNGGAGSRG